VAPAIDREAGRAAGHEAEEDHELPARVPEHAPTIARPLDPR
jgi:hypothetical protein